MNKSLVEIKNEVNKFIGDNETFKTLIITTFKGLTPQLVKRAMLEGVFRGFTFEDFLEKNVYAIPFKVRENGQFVPSYSLVTSIDYARKLGMRGGIVGKSAPKFEMDSDTIISCTVTVQKKVGEHIGDFTATVFFNEYTTNLRLWISKPRTMIAKVAEMHALRMACPEELAKAYVEEEFEQEHIVIENKNEVDVKPYQKKLDETKNIDELKKVWADFPVEVKEKLEEYKNKLKVKYEKKTKKK